MKTSIAGLLIVMLLVLGTIYVYNKFIAKSGQSIATLGTGA